MSTTAILLTDEEIGKITGTIRFKAQIRVLRALNIPVLERPDGSPCVARKAAEAALGVPINAADTTPDVILHLEAI
jgi:hypothetical protein